MPLVARIGDADTNPPPCSAGQCATGSPNVFVNNIQCGRLGDQYTCGILVNAGSPNVVANG